MAPLSPADVKRWDADAIHSVFQTASNRATTLQTLGDNLQQVHAKLSDWQGESGDAFRADLGKARHDIESDGHESRQVAAAVSRAEADVRAVKSELDAIDQAATFDGFAITSDWRIDSGTVKLDKLKAAAKQQLQSDLDACKLHAHSADQELATAVRSAVGDMAPGSQPATGQSKTWQDMLLPTGPGSGDGAKGPPVPGDAGKPPSLQDMMTGHGTPANQKPPNGDPLDLLSRVKPPPPPQLDPAAIDQFKAMARQTMINDGVPPDQIEARLNAVVANTQQWMNNGMPNYVPPEPPKAPKPGFGEMFGNTWFANEDAIHSLTGQNGADAMGDAWGGMAKGLAGKAEEYLTMGPVAPINDAVNEAKNFIDNPAGYLGGKSADAAMTAPFMMFGPEGAAARAGFGDMASLDAYAGMSHPPNLPVGLDSPTSYHPWSESAAQDLYSAFAHGEPTTGLTQHLSDMVTHYFGDDPDRVVLGKWDGQDGGYIGEAREHGGIFFDTGNPTWNAMVEGLDQSSEHAAAWPINEQFLRTQMENQIPRIEYVLPDGFDSVDQVALQRRESYSAMEINFLNQHAAEFGYRRVGNEWVYGTG